MSYDLKLFRVPDGADASLEYQQIVDRQERESTDLDSWMMQPVPEPARKEMQRIVNVLKSWRPKLEEFQPASPLPWIELNDEELEIQFEVYDGTVAVTLPYFRDRAQQMLECVTGCFETLDAAAHYSAYDPQLGRIVTLADLNQMIAKYREMDRALPEILANHSESRAVTKRPWWKLW